MKKLTKKGEVLVLKVVGPGGESHGDFVWPLAVGAIVEAPDWNPEPRCGNGLHGWLWGAGDLSAAGGRPEAEESAWLVLAVEAKSIVELDGKVKFPRCRIAARGDKTAMANIIAAHRPPNTPMPMFGQAAAGFRGQAAAGEAGQAAAGEAGQAAAGFRGQAAAGFLGQAAAGFLGQAAAGSYGQAAAGSYGQAAAGEAGQAAAGFLGQAAAGFRGQAAAGFRGQAAAGEAGQAAAGEAGQAAAGSYGQAVAGSRGQAAVEADGLATCGVGGLVKGGANAVLVAMFSTGPNRSDFSYSVGQVGRAGIEADIWYEGSAEGLRRVGDDDHRVKAWTVAWGLFDERKAARESLVEKVDEAQTGTLGAQIAKSIKPIENRK